MEEAPWKSAIKAMLKNIHFLVFLLGVVSVGFGAGNIFAFLFWHLQVPPNPSVELLQIPAPSPRTLAARLCFSALPLSLITQPKLAHFFMPSKSSILTATLRCVVLHLNTSWHKTEKLLGDVHVPWGECFPFFGHFVALQPVVRPLALAMLLFHLPFQI